jgi:hypothetical protein
MFLGMVKTLARRSVAVNFDFHRYKSLTFSELPPA